MLLWVNSLTSSHLPESKDYPHQRHNHDIALHPGFRLEMCLFVAQKGFRFLPNPSSSDSPRPTTATGKSSILVRVWTRFRNPITSRGIRQKASAAGTGASRLITSFRNRKCCAHQTGKFLILTEGFRIIPFINIEFRCSEAGRSGHNKQVHCARQRWEHALYLNSIMEQFLIDRMLQVVH